MLLKCLLQLKNPQVDNEPKDVLDALTTLFLVYFTEHLKSFLFQLLKSTDHV